MDELKDFLVVISEDSDNVNEDGIDLKLIKNLIELKYYRDIGTVEECRAAVEKQKPKQPIEDIYHNKCCPNCGWIAFQDEWGGRYLPHCENCGQALDWSEEE